MGADERSWNGIVTVPSDDGVSERHKNARALTMRRLKTLTTILRRQACRCGCAAVMVTMLLLTAESLMSDRAPRRDGHGSGGRVRT